MKKGVIPENTPMLPTSRSNKQRATKKSWKTHKPKRVITSQTAVVDEITAATARMFKTFGGGRTSEYNPLATALADKQPMFAMGVDVKRVVEFILNMRSEYEN